MVGYSFVANKLVLSWVPPMERCTTTKVLGSTNVTHTSSSSSSSSNVLLSALPCDWSLLRLTVSPMSRSKIENFSFSIRAMIRN